jgi:hypothetical protein
MKMMEIFLIFLVCLIFLVGRPEPEVVHQRQEQQAVEDEGPIENPRFINLVYKVKTLDEEPIADIIWLSKAAEIALKKGVPYFNVSNQSFHKEYVKKLNTELSVIEGTIELQSDPMQSDYDANEIISLNVTGLNN